MNFEFIDLSLDDRQFKGETHNKNLEDAMKQAIVNFCKSMDTGLFLLDMPTGFGKTYSVLDFMIDSGNEDITPAWIEWARKKADWYDPSIATEDEYLGKRQHEKNAEEKEKSLQDSIRKSWYW